MSFASRRMAGLAGVLAGAVHLGGLMWVGATEDTQVEGGQMGAVEASLGAGFADLAQGMLSGTTATEATEPVTPEETLRAASPTAAMQPIRPEETVMAHEPKDVTTAQAGPTVAVSSAPTEPDVTPHATPDAVTGAAPETQRVDVTPQLTPQTLMATDPDQAAMTQSLRPQVRSRAFETRHAPRRTTARTTAPTATSQVSRGNRAETNARAGQADGRATAPAQRAVGQGARQAGNAAASNYPGQVLQRIQRVRRPRVSAQGAATVDFRIAQNGGLSAVSLARSSGSAELDRAALLVIQRAAPFPVPPPGAQRSFSIPIMGR